MLTIQMPKSFKVGDTAQVTVNGEGVRVRRTVTALVLLPLDVDAPADSRRIVMTLGDDGDPTGLVTYICADADA